MFAFALASTAIIQSSGERGQIVSRSESTFAEPQYLLRYKSADGRAVEQWWSQGALQAEPAEALEADASNTQLGAPGLRTLTDHQVNTANDRIKIVVLDEPGSGGAHHLYAIDWKADVDGRGFRDASTGEWRDATLIRFQNGPIAETGVNGITHEALLAIIADRLRCFQNGPYRHEANGRALDHVVWAAEALKARTLQRMARGVEGTHAI